MHNESELKEILKGVKTIAVVGLSDRPDRPSYGVAKYLEDYFEIIPVNPQIASWEGRKSYPTLAAIPSEIRIDLADIFRRSSDIPAVVEDALARGIPRVWLQLGITNPDAERRLRAAGVKVVSDACLAVVHSTLGRAE